MTVPAEQSAPPADTVSRIADLSYRNYDGPLKTRAARWWIVALATVRGNLRSPGFWLLTALVALIYIINGVIFYFTRDMAARLGATGALPGAKDPYAEVFNTCLGWVGLPLFLLALVAGSGLIAADNRANALLVYLSKPITKTDYLLGKWAGVVLLLAAVSFLPALLLYLFFLAAYTGDGFLKDSPLLFLRMTGATLLPALLHGSLITGFSAWSKSPRLAGATYAGVYFVLATVTAVVGGRIVMENVREGGDTTRAATLMSLSVDGVIRGVGMHLYDAAPRQWEPRARSQAAVERPALAPLLLLGGILIVVPVAAARARIRAVEVVSG